VYFVCFISTRVDPIRAGDQPRPLLKIQRSRIPLILLSTYFDVVFLLAVSWAWPCGPPSHHVTFWPLSTNKKNIYFLGVAFYMQPQFTQPGDSA
jgi:hypothetical protein